MPASIPPFSCIVLAGGEGRRVGGQDKGLIKIESKTYVEYVVDKIKDKTDDIVISANRNMGAYQKICDTVIADKKQNYYGPLAGITACLPHCKHEWVLIVPCDMPYLPDDIAGQLYEKISNQDISIATINNRHQLVLLIKKSLLPTLQNAMDNKQLKLIQWVESQHYCQVCFDNKAQSFRNLNTL